MQLFKLEFPKEEEQYVHLMAYHQFNKKLKVKELSKLQKALLKQEISVHNYPDIEIYFKGRLLKEKIDDTKAYKRFIKIIDSQVSDIIAFKKREKTRKIQESREKNKDKEGIFIDGYLVMDLGNLKPCKLVGDILKLTHTKIKNNKKKYDNKASQVALIMEIISDLLILNNKNKVSNDIPF